MTQPSVSQALQAAKALGLERLDAELLLLHALARSPRERAWLRAHDSDLLEGAAAQAFDALSLRRVAGEPLAYLVGYQEFFGLTLQVDARVLVPRPDTETLVQWALELLQAPGMVANPSVLDLGTGSGAIAIAIAHSLLQAGQAAQVSAIDASADALTVATQNASRLGLKLQFIQSHWLEQISQPQQVIVSNPPYIASADPHLAALRHEPLQALTAGSDGLDDLRQIIDQAPARLLPGGWLLLEHGYDQAAQVRALLTLRGFAQVQSRLDLAGIQRCSGGQWPGQRSQDMEITG